MPKTTEPRPEAIHCAKCGTTVLVKLKGPIPTMCVHHRNGTPLKTKRRADLAAYLEKQLAVAEDELRNAVDDLEAERVAHLKCRAELDGALVWIAVMEIQMATLKEIAIGITGTIH